MPRLLAITLLTAQLTSLAIAQQPDTNAVLGTDPQLAAGTEAMMQGQWQRGIDLIQQGLATPLSASDRAIAFANLCAAHAALKQFEVALQFCDRSLAIHESNWRTWQNRAACHLGLGRIEESLRDLERGLRLNPDSDALQKTLAIARERERHEEQRLQQLTGS